MQTSESHQLTEYDPSVHTSAAASTVVINVHVGSRIGTVIALTTEEYDYFEVLAAVSYPADNDWLGENFDQLTEHLQIKHAMAFGNNDGYIIDNRDAQKALKRKHYQKTKQLREFLIHPSDLSCICFKLIEPRLFASFTNFKRAVKEENIFIDCLDLETLKDPAIKQALTALESLLNCDKYEL
jgi:hypothetical protein